MYKGQVTKYPDEYYRYYEHFRFDQRVLKSRLCVRYDMFVQRPHTLIDVMSVQH